MPCQVMAGRQDQARLLGRINARRRPAKAGGCPRADLDKHQLAPITSDQINFTAPHTKITVNHAQAGFLQIVSSPCFSFAPTRGSGIVVLSLHAFLACRLAAKIMSNELIAALYVVPTPLGNLADLTRRAEQVLQEVPWIAAEDTRHSAPLLKQLGARGRTLPAHQHNEHEAAARIIEKLQAGEAVALVSDAGTPGISDPGARIVAAVRAAGERVIPLPGPCAATTALSAAGIADAQFLFYGFLPSKSGQRRQALEALRQQPAALVFYEAPHRILETVADLAAVLGERTLVIARELTKLFESIHSGPLTAALDWLQADSNRQRGEFVLIVSSAPAVADHAAAERVLRLLLADGLPVKQAAKLSASITGGSKNALYERALALKAELEQ